MNSISQARKAALIMGLPIAVLSAVVLYTDDAKTMIAHGPIQAGHQEVTCQACHLPSVGSTRQQIQANVKYLIGSRQTSVSFGYEPVTSSSCLACHERANERHPIYRFREPRFIEAAARVEATNCLGCHTEHVDAKANDDTSFCQACHEDLVLKSDPLDVSHVQLIKTDNWNSCLGCHDFHGNHKYKAPTILAEAFSLDVLEAYFRNGPSPYGNAKYYEAKNEPN